MILSRLRLETRSHHDAVEAGLGLLDRPITPHDYRDLLGRFWGFYEPTEARLVGVADWPALGFNFDRRRKTPLLERDLAAMGVRRERFAGFRCPAVPPLADVPQALGCFYVLEGATLGGQVVTRYVRAQPGGPYPTAFFASYEDDVGPMWKAFGAFLTDWGTRHGGEDAIVRSARATFDALGAWLPAGERRL
jgi:heme oxygenase